jgi:hypothetical protein
MRCTVETETPSRLATCSVEIHFADADPSRVNSCVISLLIFASISRATTRAQLSRSSTSDDAMRGVRDGAGSIR